MGQKFPDTDIAEKPLNSISLAMGANIKYKDSVFSSVFSHPDILRELYCAIVDVNLPPDIPITINTLEDALFMGQLNDISFSIGDKLVVLIEHQSTINPNIALRLLMYIGRVYEKIIKPKKIYGTKLIPIPRPEFFVLYNGTAPYPDEKTLKLSDMFESASSLGLPEKSPSLELELRVININHGQNEDIIKRCETLRCYSAFVAKVREYEGKGLSLEAAIKKAIQYCIEHDILKEFMEQHGTEVISMLFGEWNLDEVLDLRFEEGIEKGREEGREEGMEIGIEKGMEKGREEGMEKGMAKVARNALAEGASLEFIHVITGLDMETIERLASRQ
jgi:hypothetical protein